MKDNGWVKVYRKIMGKGYYKRSQYVHLWLHLLLKASHKETEFTWNGKIEKLQPGQFVTGRNSLSSDTGIPASTVENILNLFETEQQIKQQKNNKFRLLTVLNWVELQGYRQQKQHPADIQPTSSRHLADTFKNIKNERIKESKSIPPTIEQVREYIKSNNYNVNPDRWFDHYQSNGWITGKTKMKDWQAAVRTWTYGDSRKSNNQPIRSNDQYRQGITNEEWEKKEKKKIENRIVQINNFISAYDEAKKQYGSLDEPTEKKYNQLKKELSELTKVEKDNITIAGDK